MDGKCCYCGFDCNKLSQTCGVCSRDLNSFLLGLDKNIEKVFIDKNGKNGNRKSNNKRIKKTF